jgi:hypothetical protein
MLQSTLFTFHGNSSELSQSFHPPLKLKDNSNYAIGLQSLMTYNNIPNITSENNKLYAGGEVFTLPTGVYTSTDISKYINHISHGAVEIIVLNNRRNQKCSFWCNKTIDFSENDTFGHLLGFDKIILSKEVWHESNFSVDMHPVKGIFVECNLANGSYFNSKSNQYIYGFPCTVPAGFQLNINPNNVIYIPTVGGTDIHDITVKIRDQDGKLINLLGESITVTLHLKPL